MPPRWCCARCATASPRIRRASRDSVDEAGAWWTVPVELVNPVTSYRFLVSRGPDGLPLAERDRPAPPRRHRRRRLPDQHRAPAAGLGARPGRLPGLPRPVRPHRRPARRCRAGRSRPTGTTRWSTRAPTCRTSLRRRPSTASPRTSTTSSPSGATLLYLTPVFEAWSNHRYDAVSFDRVDPLLGGDAALDAADRRRPTRRGLRVMGDLTTNHTGDHHDWFLAAQADPDSVERGFYRFASTRTTTPRWLDIAVAAEAGPLLRRAAPARCTTAPTRSSRTWLERGLDGWRIDVANMTGRLGRRRPRPRRGPRPAPHDAPRSGRTPGCSPSTATTPRSTCRATAGTARWTTPASPARCGAGSTAARPAGPGHPARSATTSGLPVDIPVLPAEAAVATMRDAHGAMPWALAGRARPCTSTPTTRRVSAPSPAAASTAASTPTASAAAGTSSVSACR